MKLKFVIIILFLLFMSSYLTTYYHLGERFWWLDIVQHFGGGFFIAVLIAEYFKSHLDKMAWHIRILFLIAATVLVGLLWEFYEYSLWTFFHRFSKWDYFGLARQAPNYFDTMGDLFMDLVGVIVGIPFLLHKEKSPT